ncbi:TadE/TadG family type IV pilus assembly protein [Phenylobacterium sp.]|jgi:Flp pilus assembly protein TadG|uniref:TadE/TadG family type IV pilus assembly protein n=1 Tax=Phenylobacterium sp. TaxID=1871053 RepID=UPI003783B58D
MAGLRKLLRDNRGGALVEMTLVFPLMLLLTFGLLEFGMVFWRYHTAEKATAVGARWLSTRHGVAGSAPVTTELYTAVVPDCFVNTTQAPGTRCSQIAGAAAWTQTCSGAGGGGCNAGVMAALVAQMQQYAPFITPANVTVRLRGSTVGFVGRGRAVPLITVETTGLTYNLIAVDALVRFWTPAAVLGPITLPSFASTFLAEDQKEGPGL